MKLPSRRANAPELPGVVGKARVGRRTASLLTRLRPGDVAVLHEPDLDASVARGLLEHGVVAVVNTASFVTGNYPTLGPQMLSDAGVILIEATPAQAARIDDGAEVRIDDGTVHGPETELLRGLLLGPDLIARARDSARGGMDRQLDAITRNSAEFLRREQALLLDGEGLPTLTTSFEGRTVVVVARGNQHNEELAELRRFVNEQRPVLIGVDAGAQVLLEHGMRPDVVLVSSGLIGEESDAALPDEVLKQARELVVHRSRSGTTAGAERLQRWGIRAHTMTTDVHPFDLALLMADACGAQLIVPVGRDATFEEFLDRGRSDQASAFLTRLRVGGRLVDATAVPRLYSGRVRGWHLLLIVLAALFALWLAVATTPIGNTWWHDTNAWFGQRVAQVKELLT
ncbi:MAG: putative cytokinetic ring protein SteA [Actinomycetota bacterium]|nr:putative cytokinetic ring protein SteA [Actinomycetota bacterium]